MTEYRATTPVCDRSLLLTTLGLAKSSVRTQNSSKSSMLRGNSYARWTQTIHTYSDP